MRVKTGILFGGSSKHREKSFHGAQSLYAHLSTYTIEKVLIWINKEGKFFHVKDSCFLQGDLPGNVLQEIDSSTLGQYINIAVVTISADDQHYELLFETLFQLNIPNNLNSLSRKFALDLENWWNELKIFNFRSPSFKKLSLSAWNLTTTEQLSNEIKKELGGSVQIIPMPYSSKNGGSFIDPNTKEDIIQERLNRAFFRDWINKSDWQNMSDYEKSAWITWLSDPLEGPDFPLHLVINGVEKKQINQPQDFIENLDALFAADLSEELIIGIEPMIENAYIQLVGIPNGIPFQSVIWFHEDTWQCLPPFINNDQILPGKNQSENLTELQSAEISSQMIQIGQSFLFNSPQVISGFVTSTGKSYPIEIQPFVEIIDEKKWFNHLGAIDQTPTSFLDIVLRQILSLQAYTGGISGKIASQLNLILSEKDSTDTIDYSHAILLDSIENINKSYLIEALGWYEKLAIISPSDNLIILSENSSIGQFFYVVPARWLYITIQKKAEIKDFVERIRKHCPKIDPKALKEYGYTVIPVTSGKMAAQGTLFCFFETEKIPYWGSASIFSNVNFTKSIQIQTLNKNGFKTLPSWQIATWLQQNISHSNKYVLTSNEYTFQSTSIEILGEHEIIAFKKFISEVPVPNETQRHRKIWQHFYEEIQEPERLNAFLQEYRDDDDLIVSFFNVKKTADSFDRVYLTPVHVAKGDNLQIKYLFSTDESELLNKIQPVWTALTAHIEKALEILGFACPGYVRFNVIIFEDQSFEILFKEINPLFSSIDPWLEKQLIYNKITWNHIISQQNEYAKFKIPTEEGIEETEESFISFEEKKLPFQHLNSDIVVEKVELPEEAPEEERENRIKEAMNNLTPTRFSKNFNDYAIELWHFLKSWFFIKNMLAFIVSIFLVVNIIKGVLYFYTRHGSGKEVIDYSGMRFDSALEKAGDQGLKLVASDEVYVLNRPAGIIISQTPEKGSKIKSGRTIYCVVTGGDAPSVTLPKLSNNDEYEAYQRQLIRLGVYSRIREERFESEYEEKTILEVYFEGKKLSNGRINAGQVKLPKGSYLDFVISVRNTDRAPVPNLICNTYEEAVTNIIANDLTVGTIIGPENNESFSGMFVYKQEPTAGEGVFLAKGSQVILYLQTEKPEQCPEY
jgi:hypothetical protein